MVAYIRVQESDRAERAGGGGSVKEMSVLETLYFQLTAQIAIYAGQRNGGLATLQDYVGKRDHQQPVICECCGGELSGHTGGHKEDCAIVAHYFTLFPARNGEPTE
jgi:hypothetical protein